jgi:hypothetical protein
MLSARALAEEAVVWQIANIVQAPPCPFASAEFGVEMGSKIHVIKIGGFGSAREMLSLVLDVVAWGSWKEVWWGLVPGCFVVLDGLVD